MDNNGRTCVVTRRAVLETTMIVRVNDALIILLQWVYVCMAIHLKEEDSTFFAAKCEDVMNL